MTLGDLSDGATQLGLNAQNKILYYYNPPCAFSYDHLTTLSHPG